MMILYGRLKQEIHVSSDILRMVYVSDGKE